MTPSPERSNASLLGVVGYELWKAHLVGNSCPSNTRRFNRMRVPRTGDLVLETSSALLWMLGIRQSDWHVAENGVGYLLREAREAIPNWDEAELGEPAPTEKIWYIRTLDGRELRWTNADFIAILPVEGWRGFEVEAEGR